MQSASIKTGLFGAGKFGFFHANNLVNTDFEFVGVFDPVEERAISLAGKFGIKYYPDADQLMDACDAVLIITTTIHHFGLIRKAIQKQKHIFVEKPVVASYGEMLELNALAKNYPKIIQAGHIERFNLMLQDAFHGEEKPWLINATRLSSFNPRVSDVSVIHDLMIHDIDSILTIAGSEVMEIHATGNTLISGCTDVCSVHMTFHNGLKANLFAGRIYIDARREMELYYSDRIEQLDFQTRTNTVSFYRNDEMPNKGNGVELMAHWPEVANSRFMFRDVKKYPENNSILAELTEFYHSIAFGKPVRVGLHDAGRTMYIIDQIEAEILKAGKLYVHD